MTQAPERSRFADGDAALRDHTFQLLQTTAPMAMYANRQYCQLGYLDEFLQAWQLNATPARTGEILRLLDEAGPRDCKVTGTDGSAIKVRLLRVIGQRAREVQRVYLLHSPSIRDPSAAEEPPHLIRTLQLDSTHALTVMEDPNLPDHVSIDGQPCINGIK